MAKQHLLDWHIQVQGLDLWPQILSMVDDMSRTHLLREGDSLWSRGRRDDHWQL